MRVGVLAALCPDNAPKVLQKVPESSSRAPTDLFVYLSASVSASPLAK